MTFSGWPEQALDFYEDLENDNSKSFWTAHKAIYDEAVLRPMTELTEELADEFGEAKIYRPYRDLRFSADKTPYKTNIGASIGAAYIQLSASGLAAGNGMYHMASDQLERYRQAVANDLSGHELERTIAELASNGYESLGRDNLKKAPRGFPGDHPRIELLKYKGLIAWHEWPVEPWLSTPKAKDYVREFLIATRPLSDWLYGHVGESEFSDDRR
jgi:uncharacterized protein (TIGR02453 family)